MCNDETELQITIHLSIRRYKKLMNLSAHSVSVPKGPPKDPRDRYAQRALLVECSQVLGVPAHLCAVQILARPDKGTDIIQGGIYTLES